MKRFILIFGLAIAPLLASAAAQSYEEYVERQRDLTVISAIFGEMHHIRRTCDPRYEADVWRERMKQLITLEEPDEQFREQLVAQFNDGYRKAQRAFSGCDRRARDYAAARAAQGEGIIRRLTASLEEEEQFVDGPLLIQPDAQPVTVND